MGHISVQDFPKLSSNMIISGVDLIIVHFQPDLPLLLLPLLSLLFLLLLVPLPLSSSCLWRRWHAGLQNENWLENCSYFPNEYCLEALIFTSPSVSSFFFFLSATGIFFALLKLQIKNCSRYSPVEHLVPHQLLHQVNGLLPVLQPQLRTLFRLFH